MAENYDALELVEKAELERNVDDDNQFPVGLRVLAIDEDAESLDALACLLSSFRYNATPTRDATTAIDVLRKESKSFDIVIADIHMVDMNGFDFLDTVHREMDIPVVMVLSESDGVGRTMEAIKRGACSFLTKPIRREEIQNIWQHVFRKYMMNGQEPLSDKSTRSTQSDCVGCSRNSTSQGELGHDIANSTSSEAKEGLVPTKKARISWNEELHGKFMDAVNQLGGLDAAVPKDILRLTNVKHLSRASVASHLQKCRDNVKKKQNQKLKMNELSPANMAMLNWNRSANPLSTMLNHSISAPTFSNLPWSPNPVLHEEQRSVTQDWGNPVQDVYMGFPFRVPDIGVSATTLMGEGSAVPNYQSDTTFQDSESEQIKTICSSMGVPEGDPGVEKLLQSLRGRGKASDSSEDFAQELNYVYIDHLTGPRLT
ncbi:hypothetical protein Drorol1_Dr00001665 [Drosera rotundifolia]